MKIFLIIQIFLFTIILSACKPAEKVSSKNINNLPVNGFSMNDSTIPFDIKVEPIITMSDKIQMRESIVNDMEEKTLLKKPDVTLAKTGIKPLPKDGVIIVKVKNSKIYSDTENEGKVIYKIPPIMKVRNTYPVLVRITKSSINVYENLEGEIRESRIPITETMEVKLIDPSPEDNKAFYIVADNDAVQFVDSLNSYTQWSWNVTPLRVGETNLKVVVSIIREGKTKQVVYEDNVKVKANVGKQIGFWFKSYWQWIFITLLLPLFKFIYNKVKKK